MIILSILQAQTPLKISRYMLKKVGDLTWHYHAGIRTVPMQIAVEKKFHLLFGESMDLLN